MINIGIYNEHKLALEGTLNLFNKTEEINVSFTCDEKAMLKNKLNSNPIHILLLTIYDISIKSINLIVQLSIDYPKTKILIISIINSEEMILKTIKSGAKGFLGKESDFDDLREAIFTIRNGHDYYSKSITHLLLNRYIKKLKDDVLSHNSELSVLSSRQIEIVKLWGNSYSNQEIAEQLFISVRTVESHKNHIMQKLNLKSTVDLVKFGIKNNIIEI